MRIGAPDDLHSVHLEALATDRLMVRARGRHAVEAAVSVELQLPDGGPLLVVEGRICRVEPGENVTGVEIELLDTTPGASDRLARVVESSESLDENDDHVDSLSEAELARQVKVAAAQVVSTERHLARLGNHLEVARQTARASRTLVQQLEAAADHEDVELESAFDHAPSILLPAPRAHHAVPVATRLGRDRG